MTLAEESLNAEQEIMIAQQKLKNCVTRHQKDKVNAHIKKLQIYQQTIQDELENRISKQFAAA